MINHNTILVTGGAGFIGSHLVERLSNNENEIIVFDNGFRVGYEHLKNSNNVSLIKGDVTKIQDWGKIPKKIDYVFHLAAINGTRYFYEMPEKVLEVNIKGMQNFLEWIKNTDVESFFFASSSEVYGYPEEV